MTNNNWVIATRVPDSEEQYVLGYDRHGDYCIVKWFPDSETWEDSECLVRAIMFWQPLPDPPPMLRTSPKPPKKI